MIFGDWLLSFSIMFSRFIPAVTYTILPSFLRSNTILLCGYIMFWLFIHQLIHICVVAASTGMNSALFERWEICISGKYPDEGQAARMWHKQDAHSPWCTDALIPVLTTAPLSFTSLVSLLRRCGRTNKTPFVNLLRVWLKFHTENQVGEIIQKIFEK